MLFLLLLVASVEAATALDIASLLDIPEDIWRNDSWFVPNSEMEFSWVTKDTVRNEIASLLNERDLVQYELFTNLNPTTSQNLQQDNNSLALSNFNTDNPTVFIIHGFKNSYNDPVCTLIRDALLKRGPHNVICVDWSRIAERTYPTARFAVPLVGRGVAMFVDFLITTGGMSMNDLKIMGHSLGAHVAGFASKHLRNVPHTIGLDPAFPLFLYEDCRSRLCETDAQFVETIQTCGGRLGFARPIGELTFYPNGGLVQPGCEPDIVGLCAHSRSYIYLAEAIMYNNFPAKQCKSFVRATLGACKPWFSKVRMGSPSNYGTRGIYYVPVNDEPPYGKGAIDTGSSLANVALNIRALNKFK